MIPKPFAGAWVLGGQDDRAACEGLAAAAGKRVIAAAGRLTLRQSAALLERCALYVGNDTGTKHLAAAAGVPVVEICGCAFGGDEESPRSPSRFGAWGVANRIVRPCHGMDIAAVDAMQAAQAIAALLAEPRMEAAQCPA